MFSVGGDEKWQSYVGKQFVGFFQNFKYTYNTILQLCFRYLFWKMIIYVYTKICRYRFMVVFFRMFLNWRCFECFLVGECISKSWCGYILEYDAVIKRNRFRINRITWVNFKSFMFSEELDLKGCVLQDVIYLNIFVKAIFCLQIRGFGCQLCLFFRVIVVSCVVVVKLSIEWF